ncbi:hypothetical protein HDV01_003059 [Terramyces sp. JEL0728]|nr:hypothetical protein HDV01_003059 [Terramyces sp. JEL0728]
MTIDVSVWGFDGIVGGNALVNISHGNYSLLNILGLVNLFSLKDIVKCFRKRENQTEINK